MTTLAKQDRLTATAELDIILACLNTNQAQNPVVIHLSGRVSFTDYMVVVTGRNLRHMDALAQYTITRCKQDGLQCYREGTAGEEWILLDTGTVIVHIFSETARAQYALENMWQDALP